MIRKLGIQGVTLVELMVALTILSIGLLGVSRMQLSSLQGNAFGGRISTGLALAQNKMEGLINQDLDPWPTDPSEDSQSNPTFMGRQYNGYTITWTITPDTPNTDMATLDVRVQWPGGGTPISLIFHKRR